MIYLTMLPVAEDIYLRNVRCAYSVNIWKRKEAAVAYFDECE
jgi:hypothetical protein